MKTRALLLFVLTLAAAAGCAPSLTWSDDARPLVEESCVQCHDGRSSHAPSFRRYDGVAAHAQSMYDAASAGVMPPFVVQRDGSCGEFLGPQRPGDDALARFAAWIDAGAPRGDDAADAAAPDEPSVPGAAVALPSYVPHGSAAFPSDDHRCFLVDVDGGGGFLTSLAAELSSSSSTPSSGPGLHHVLVFTLAHEEDDAFARALDDNDPEPGWSCPGPTGVAGATIAAVWAPGAPAARFPPDSGVAVGAHVVVQVHVAVPAPPAAGASTVDVTLHLGVREAVARTIAVRTASTTDFVLPPGEALVEHEAQLVPSASDGEIVAIFPHMHRAGVSLRLSRADGSCLVDVPRWRYTSQELVQPRTPPSLAAREALTLSCAWSTQDRASETRFGEGTGDEMCSVFLFVAAP